MTTNFDPLELASAIAEIASRTLEPQTARSLLELANGLLTDAGLPELPARDQEIDHFRS